MWKNKKNVALISYSFNKSQPFSVEINLLDFSFKIGSLCFYLQHYIADLDFFLSTPILHISTKVVAGGAAVFMDCRQPRGKQRAA